MVKVRLNKDEKYPVYYIVPHNAPHDVMIKLTEDEYDLIMSIHEQYEKAQEILAKKFKDQ